MWDRGSGALWVMQKGMVRKYEFANPSQVQEMKIEPGDLLNIPAHLQEPMKKAFDVPGAPVQKQMPEKPTGASAPQMPKLPDDAYTRPGVHGQKFREEDAKRPGGELMGAVLEPSKPEDRAKEPLVPGVRTASNAQWRIGGTARVGLVVRNRSNGDVKFSYTGRLDNGLSIVAVDEAGKEHGAVIAQFDGLLTFQQMLLPEAHVATIKEFTLRFDAEKRDVSEPFVEAFHLPPGQYKLRCKWNDAHPDVAHEGEWAGELVNEDLEFTLAAPAVPAAEKPKGAAAVKLTSDALLGFWRGERKGERMVLSFHRPPVETDAQLDIYFGEATIGAPASFSIAPDGKSVALMMHSANGRVPFGTLHPGEAGTLRFESDDEKNKLPGGVVFTREREEPRQKEPRELFDMWKITANADGTITGTFIGALATEVRAYLKANPNPDSGMKLPKMLPRFVTTRDWTEAEAIKLLDDVAYYSTAPIAARVAKAKLPSDALWPTKVEFQGCPVKIEKWSEAKDGLRIGMRVVDGEWRVGGEVNVGMWLHNAGTKDLTLKANPQRSDVGV